MTARLMLVVLLATATVAAAVDFPEAVSASKCKGRKKVFGFIDDPTGTPAVRKIKMSDAVYIEPGNAYVQGCKTFEGSDCQETFRLGLVLSPGLSGEIPCGMEFGLPNVEYTVMPEGAGVPRYWTNTDDCTVTIVKYDYKRGRLKGMYRTHLVDAFAEEPVYAELVGCFKVKYQRTGPDE